MTTEQRKKFEDYVAESGGTLVISAGKRAMPLAYMQRRRTIAEAAADPRPESHGQRRWLSAGDDAGRRPKLVPRHGGHRRREPCGLGSVPATSLGRRRRSEGRCRSAGHSAPAARPSSPGSTSASAACFSSASTRPGAGATRPVIISTIASGARSRSGPRRIGLLPVSNAVGHDPLRHARAGLRRRAGCRNRGAGVGQSEEAAAGARKAARVIRLPATPGAPESPRPSCR